MKKTSRFIAPVLIAPALIVMAIHFIVGASPATAGFLTPDTLDEILDDYDKGSILVKKNLIKRIGNLGVGMEKINRALESRGSARVFCPPPEPTLTDGHYFDIVKRKVGFYPELGAIPENEVGTLLLDALIKMYPCPQ